jgi:proteasome alpha subunit
MGYTPYDWNEQIQHRVEYVENRLRQGSPVAGCVYEGGVLLVSVRGSQRKVFEVYDHILFSAMGSQQDVEAIRLGSIDFAHQEGFNRSPDDVSVQRLVTGLSPTLKRAFADGFGSPYIIRAIFAELGRTAQNDKLTTLNYDGEYAVYDAFAAIAGSTDAEGRMRDAWEEGSAERPSLQDALPRALRAWSIGAAAARRRRPGADEDVEEDATPRHALQKALEHGAVEVGVLERHGSMTRFRLLRDEETAAARTAVSESE